MPSKSQKSPLVGIRVIEKAPNSFLLLTGTREKGDIFVSTPAIREVIAKYDLQHSQLGYITLQVNSERKYIHTAEYYPFQYGAGHLFFRKGVATLVELQIEKLMQRRFPGYKIVSSPTSLFGRYSQMVKRGRVPGEPIPIEAAVALSRAKVIANHLKQKEKKSRSLRGRFLRFLKWIRPKKSFH